jgi:hypothetical protein
MKPKDRYLATLRGGVADRVPLELAGCQFSSHDKIDAHPDPYRRELAHRVFDEQTFYVDVPSFVNRYLVTAPQFIHTVDTPLPGGNTLTEGAIATPRGPLTFITEYSPVSDTSWTLKYPVESHDDLDALASVPWELPVDLAPPDPASFPADFDTRGIASTRVSSPFVCVSGAMSFESFLAMTATDLGLLVELTEMCRLRTIDVLEVLLSEPGLELIWLGGSEWVTAPMARPETYDALVQEQERSLIEYVHDNSAAVVQVHCHGRVRHALQRTIERGADYTEPCEPPPLGDITLAEAKALSDGRITLGGNIECRILAIEDEEAVEAAVRTAFEGGKERFVLRPTEDPSPTMSEQEFRNYARLVDVWEELAHT